jgi:hypothetical protein
MLAAPFLLAACQQADAPTGQPAPAPAPKSGANGDITTAERVVRARIGTTGETRFFGARRNASEGVPIVCGQYEQGGVRHRYIVVGGEEAFVEPRMRPGEMDRAVAEFCGEGNAR